MLMSPKLAHLSTLLTLLPLAVAQLPDSYPEAYPGKPDGELNDSWQSYFQVDNSALPNITFALPRSYAGSLPVNRDQHPNNTLFFWGFEKSDGSLTADSTEPWLIWLQGGPGSSSLAGLVIENGPIRLQDDFTFAENMHSWNRLVDTFWIDQPVGTGFSTADANGYVTGDDQMATDFIQFLSNLVKVFPGLAQRPLVLAGESYAGRWIPYISKALFSLEEAPVELYKIMIGDGAITNDPVFLDVPAISVLETYPQLIGYDQDVYEYFRQQHHLCGYDLNLTYPQIGALSTVQTIPANDLNSPYSSSSALGTGMSRLRLPLITGQADRIAKRGLVRYSAIKKRGLDDRANGTIDSWYGCNLMAEIQDYATNFSSPWSTSPNSFNPYDIPDATYPKSPSSPVGALNPDFFNDPRTRAALHAPTSKNWTLSLLPSYPFGSVEGGEDPSPEPMAFLTELATNATAKNVSIILYSGNDDSLIAHRSTEVAIQNTTFGGIGGFIRRPSTPWFDDEGNFAGIVHQERGWTYALFDGASHLVPQKKPESAFVFLREFVLGSNPLGSFQVDGNGYMTVVGGENEAYAKEYLAGSSGIVYGDWQNPQTTMYPSETVQAWNGMQTQM